MKRNNWVRRIVSISLPFLRHREDNPDDAVQAIIGATKARIERNELGSNVVDVETVTAVVADLTSGEQDLAESSTQTQNAFLRPRLYFDPVRNTLLL